MAKLVSPSDSPHSEESVPGLMLGMLNPGVHTPNGFGSPTKAAPWLDRRPWFPWNPTIIVRSNPAASTWTRLGLNVCVQFRWTELSCHVLLSVSTKNRGNADVP